MALKVADLMVQIGADTKGLEKGVTEADSKLSGFAKTAGAFGVAIAAGAGASAVALYKVGESFDQVRDTIRVGTGATGQALDGLMDSARNIGKTVPADFDQIGTAVADLNTRLGLSGKPLEDMAGQFLNLSRITGTDVSTNIAGITRLFGDWGVAVEDQPAKLDAIYRASQATGAGIDTLATSATKFGGPMRQLGFSFDETLALLGKFEKEGVNADLVMGSMRIALGKMAKAGEEPVETLTRVTDQIKNAGSAGEANALALEMFGSKAGPDMAAAIREGRFEIGDLLATISGGSDTINGAAADTADFAEKWQLFKNNVLLLIEPIAARVFDALGRGMEWISSQVPRFEHLAAVVAERFGPALAAAGAAAVVAFTYLRAEALPVVVDLAREVLAFGERVVPVLVGAFTAVVSAGFQVVAFLNEHRMAVGVTAGILSGVLIPVLVLLGIHWVTLQVKAAASAARQAAAWLVTQASALQAAAVHGAQVLAMVGRWLLLGAQAVLHAGKVAAAWALTAARAVAAGVVHLAQVALMVGRWVLLGVQSLLHAAKVAAGWAMTSAAALGAAAVHAAHVAAMVTKWAFLGVQSLLHAAKVAAAWVLAMGPVGWVIATVVGLVALIIANWDTVKRVTGAAWEWVTQKLGAAWEWMKDKTALATLWIVDKLLWWADKVIGAAASAFSWVPGLGPKLDEAKSAVQAFREKTNAEMDAIRNKDIKVNVGVDGKWSAQEIRASYDRRDAAMARRAGTGDGPGIGDGPGHAPVPAPRISRAGGSTGSLVRGLENAHLTVGEKARHGLDGVLGTALPGIAAAAAAALKERAAAGVGGQPLGVQRMMAALNSAFGNVRLISGLRPGAITATGNPSYHGKGRAVDIPPSMAYFEWIRQNYPDSRELIFSPAGGRQIHNGRPHVYTGVTRAMHFDHVHWAYDRGGLARGMGLMPKLTAAPERVLSPQQTRAFEQLVSVLDRSSLNAVQTQPVPVEKHLHYHAATGRSMPEEDFFDAAGRARMLGW